MNWDDAQCRNFAAAMDTARRWALGHRGNVEQVEVRVAFAIWTESNGYVYANDGTNSDNSPGVTAERAAILRRSIDPAWLAANALRMDRVGSNGRSTGPLQQLSSDVGGVWGDMAGTMRVGNSVTRFLDSTDFAVTDDPVYIGDLQRPNGTTRRVSVTLSNPIAADVLRVQQPLASEAESPNYSAQAVSIALSIVTDFGAAAKPPPKSFLAKLLSWENTMTDDVVIYHITCNGSLYEANLLAGSHFRFATMDDYNYRTSILGKAGIPYKLWDGVAPATMDGFGIEIKSQEALVDAVTDKILRHSTFTSLFSGGQINVLDALQWIERNTAAAAAAPVN